VYRIEYMIRPLVKLPPQMMVCYGNV
jgi:hypothetical protein